MMNDDAIRRTLEAQLRGTEFNFAQPIIRRRIIIEIAAREKRGKTHLAATAPGPIAYLNFDQGEEGVLDKPQFKKKVIIPARFGRVPPNTPPAQAMPIAQEIWQKFTNTYEAALKNATFKTIIIDTGTELWDTLRMARFGKYEQVPQHLYGFANREMSDQIRKAYDYDKNLIILSKMGKEYKGGEKTGKITESFWTGRYERKGFGDMPYIVQIYGESDYDYAAKKFVFCVIECRQNPALYGRVYENAEFWHIGCDIFPDTTPMDWGAEG